MLDEQWDAFVIYVNAYYAVQEAYDAARREWKRPATGLDAFCRDANPFLWDGKSSAEEGIYQSFLHAFTMRFPHGTCSPEEGYAFARTWLETLEGKAYGTALVSSFDQITNAREFARACRPVSRQLAARASHLERTPQDMPEPTEPAAAWEPSEAQINAVIDLLANGDAAFAASLRARLESDEG